MLMCSRKDRLHELAWVERGVYGVTFEPGGIDFECCEGETYLVCHSLLLGWGLAIGFVSCVMEAVISSLLLFFGFVKVCWGYGALGEMRKSEIQPRE
jgi:hypothetical protein